MVQAVNHHRALSQLLDRREPVHVFTHPFADREDHLDDRFLASGVAFIFLESPVFLDRGGSIQRGEDTLVTDADKSVHGATTTPGVPDRTTPRGRPSTTAGV